MPSASGRAASNSGDPGPASTTRARSFSQANGVGSESSVTSTSGGSAMPPVIANGSPQRQQGFNRKPLLALRAPEEFDEGNPRLSHRLDDLRHLAAGRLAGLGEEAHLGHSATQSESRAS